jgi:ATP-dependent RNA helicase DDX51/DBP6
LASAPSLPVSGSSNPPDDSESPLLDHRAHNTPTPTPPPPSLPRFPLPSRPRVPEKSELVSQGLDRALAHAQLVDPLLSTPLLLDDENARDVTVAGLSARMIRRLRDLGITELFAGAYHLTMFSRHRKHWVKIGQHSPDHAGAVAPPPRTSETISLPPI